MTSSNTPSLKALATRGAIWTIVGFGSGNLLRLGSNLILTRLLEPKLFGLMALVYTFYVGLNMFSDVGINVSIIQNKRGDDPPFLNTAWTLQVIRGFILWVGCLLLAYPVSRIYGEPKLLWLLPVVGLSAVIMGFANTSLQSLNRHLAVKQIAIIELSSQLFGTTLMILWAWLSPSILALVAGGIASSTFQVAASYYFSKGKLNALMLEASATREILSFGAWIFVATAMTFFAERGDQLILSKVIGLELFGIYIIAFTFADIPRAIMLALSGKVFLPAFSKLVDQPRAILHAKINYQRNRIILIEAIGLAILVSFGDEIIKFLYDDRYLPAAWMLPILALGIWPRLLCITNEPVLFALGKPQYTAAANLNRFICTALGIWAGYTWIGLPGAIIGIALNDLGYYLTVNYGLYREQLSSIKQDLFATGLMLLISASLLIIRYSLGFGTPINELFT